MPTTLIGTIIAGALIGWVASILVKTNDQMGCLWNVLIGVVGGFLGHWIAGRFFHFHAGSAFSLSGFAVGVGGAVVLLLILQTVGIFSRRRRGS